LAAVIEDLVILGAGGASREIADAVSDINRLQPRWNLLGFLDDDPAKLGQSVDDLPVLGPIASAAAYRARFVIGVAAVRNRSARSRIGATLVLSAASWATIIHPSASVSRHATIGVGTALLQNVVVCADTVVGDHCFVDYGVMISHDACIENFVTIAPGATVSGGVHLGAGTYVGAGAMLRDGVSVGEGAILGMGAVVVKDVPPAAVMVGNPARQLPG